ncbi:uncharacterized protein [Coffea arabica]|uniref:Reverse transcriptase domain-containing protein n=1 Tax=Coffea arabica TaxID=13443 RepID=A0ABM4UFM9_COFAR
MEFKDFITEANLTDIDFSGARFTWCNNRQGRARIWKRLDRVLLNEGCLDLGLDLAISHLARESSDHAPLLMSVSTRLDNKPRPFKFLNFWTGREDFLPMVQDSWGQPCPGSPLHVLCCKLKRLRSAIQAWNREAFGDIFQTVRQQEEEVRLAELRVESDESVDARVNLHLAQGRLRAALRVEEMFWEQKARVRWLQEGDRLGMVEGWAESEEEIGAEAVRYFEDLFTAQHVASSSTLLNHIPKILTVEENDLLEQVPSEEEIRSTVFAMDGDSTPGPDGYTGKFFTAAWSVIGEDVVRAVGSFFCGADLPRAITATSIVLIPKIAHPQDFSHFRPISLCNFVNKLISRILADRLAQVLPKIIFPQQSGFVRERIISDNFLLAQELLSSMGRTSRNADVALKLDMSKAYDRVSWVFLTMVLRRFGFGEQWIDRVWRLVSNIWFSVLVNGASVGFFKSTRGIRQGDPLSPGLFIIGAEVMSRSLNKLLENREFKCFLVPKGCPKITHLSYTDDVLVFSGACSSSLRCVIQTIGGYEAISGQKINVQKCGFLTHDKLPSYCMARVRRATGFGHKSFPVRYSGCPLFTGLRKSVYFMEMGSSYVWRRMLQIREVAEQNLSWLVRSGQCNFWFDNWLGSGPLCQRLPSVSDHPVGDFVLNGLWNQQLLRRWVPDDIVSEIITKSPPVCGVGFDGVRGFLDCFLLCAPGQAESFLIHV